ncbi:HAMP domain-containing sensor histidine kinase [Paraflavitalea speifideaquila]|uniref:sensor histidine kinase n=1 Tax=Paraflavitalea speifideaquila TaxID=3076558 RepID=UPI0028E54D39|nr:HAMP domain-containing sensor histidine kinase [Paraflavitalea speifideiaquila]
MTHELKTPIFTISIASRMMGEQAGNGATEKNNSFLQSIRQETDRLKNLVETVLETATLQQKQVVFEKTTLDLHELIRQSVETFQPVAWQQQGEVILQLEAATPYIYANQLQISNMLNNLLDNAFKYTTVHPQIILSTTNQQHYIVCSIKDNGLGMDEDTQALIFERFYRASTGNLHQVKGYGIGLSYVQSVVIAHDGRILVKSAPNKGSEFIIQLPTVNNGQQHSYPAGGR